MPSICAATAPTMRARCHSRPYHCHRAMAMGVQSITTMVAFGPPQKEKLARAKPPEAIHGSGFAMKAGNRWATPGKKYSRDPTAPIQVPTAKSAVSAHFQLSFLAIAPTATTPRGSKRRKLRNSENILLHGTAPHGPFSGIAAINPHTQKPAKGQTQAGVLNTRCFACGVSLRASKNSPQSNTSEG